MRVTCQAVLVIDCKVFYSARNLHGADVARFMEDNSHNFSITVALRAG